jgi:hypothetical protein
VGGMSCDSVKQKHTAISALVNQVAQPNPERNGNSVQLHDADIPYSPLYARYVRPMQPGPLRELFLC